MTVAAADERGEGRGPMNLIDCWVTEVLGESYQGWGRWWRKVKSIDMGGEEEHTLMFDSKEEADRVQVGYKFLA